MTGRVCNLLAASILLLLIPSQHLYTGVHAGRHAGPPRGLFGAANGTKINYETKWFTQLTDHFTWANQDTFQQRYLVNTDNWCGQNCPILFYCGNEGDIEMFTNNTGWMWENAAEFHAMLVFAEHRFYGKSLPYPVDISKETPHLTAKLGYLSSEQALADYARLIHALRNTIYDSKLSPVIAVGGSYGGMLASWMRMKYPNAVLGALAGSAPILQFPGQYECSLFSKIATKDFEDYSPFCSQSIAKSWNIIREYAKLKSSAELGRIFNTCSPLREREVELLLQMLSAIWVNMAMTDYANEATFLSVLPAYPIKHVCSFLSQNPALLEPVKLIENIALASQVYTNFTGTLQCLDIKTFLFDPMDVLWDFQSCTEMVMPICSDGTTDMFDPEPFNLTSFQKDCKERWGVNTQVDKIETLYGDKRLDAASNIIFSSCSRDPWSAGCPQDSKEDRNIHAIKIPGVCHHEDLRASGPNDSEALRKARRQEVAIISDWIQKYYADIRANTESDKLVKSDSVPPMTER